MKEVYRKRGRVIRRERERLIRVSEAGEARDDGTTFSVTPLEVTHLPDIDSTAVDEVAATIEALVKPPLILERMIVSDGVAEHDCNGITWSENTRRIHLAIARPPMRAIVDLADFSLEVVQHVVDALRRGKKERQARHIRLAAHVGAALLPALIGSEEMEQGAAPHDGRGRPIEQVRVTNGKPPNWFRPSYRVRPVRAWFHLRAVSRGQLDPALPEAVALLAPVEGRKLQVLFADGSTATFEAKRILAVNATDEWYPYAAGAFGAEMML